MDIHETIMFIHICMSTRVYTDTCTNEPENCDWVKLFDLQFLSQFGSTYDRLWRSVPEIH